MERAYAAGVRDARVLCDAGHAVLADEPAVALDYLAVADGDTLEPAAVARDGAVAMIAARVGRTRLLDNVRLGVPAYGTGLVAASAGGART
jgi:pantoate--beta-alanine ligase